MRSTACVFLLAATVFKLNGQIVSEESVTIPPSNIGGKNQIEQIVKTQLVIPSAMQNQQNRDVTVFFTVTKEGHVMNPFFKEKLPEFYEAESKRLLNYFVFEPGKIGTNPIESFGSLTFNFNTDKYKSWVKERKFKATLNKQIDSTFTVYEVADKSPEFYKGEDALAEFVLSTIEYPNVAKTQNIEGTVNLSFIIEANGYVSNVKVLKGVNGGCSEEAVRVINLTRWKPAEKNGKYVRYKTTYPITFNIKIVNRDNSNSQQ